MEVKLEINPKNYLFEYFYFVYFYMLVILLRTKLHFVANVLNFLD